MRVLPFKIPKPTNSALLFQVDTAPFYNQLHQHEELQISLILKGEGTLLVSDGIHSFKEDMLFVLAENQPHVFRNTSETALMHSLFVNVRSFGETFLQLEEGQGILDFYAFAKAGLKTKATTRLKARFEKLSSTDGISRFAETLGIIKDLQDSEIAPLSQFIYQRQISEADGRKMQTIFEYSLSHYDQPVTLETVATVAAMSRNGFCKYFKKRTNKTYFQFLNEIRIAQACKLLKESPNLPIAAIAIQSGFNTLSHFNRTFLKQKGVAPSGYRKSEAV